MLCRGSIPLLKCKYLGRKVWFIQIDEMDTKESSDGGLRVGNGELVVRGLNDRNPTEIYEVVRKIWVEAFLST